MPCDSKLKTGQTIKARALEVREVVERLAKGLVRGTVKAVVGPTGGIAFTGLTNEERDGVTDACMYRRVLATGSPLALQAIQRAEAAAGRSVDRMAVAHGHHAHADAHGALHWHNHKG